MAIDWTKIYKKYKGLWVALDGKEKKVIASDKEAKKTFEKAQKKELRFRFYSKSQLKLFLMSVLLFGYEI